MFEAMFARSAPVALCTGLCVSGAFAAPLAQSHFDAGTEGWKLAGDTTTADPTWVATGGNPGGYVNGVDRAAGGIWYWSAPAAFLGNISSAYGHNLSFDLRKRGSGSIITTQSDVVLTSGSLQIHLDLNLTPIDPAWTSYSPLLSTAEDWRVGSRTGAVATEAQIRSVLASLDSLRIRGEYIDGSDNGDLDNVVLLPAPSAMALMGLGGLVLSRRRR